MRSLGANVRVNTTKKSLLEIRLFRELYRLETKRILKKLSGWKRNEIGMSEVIWPCEQKLRQIGEEYYWRSADPMYISTMAKSLMELCDQSLSPLMLNMEVWNRIMPFPITEFEAVVLRVSLPTVEAALVASEADFRTLTSFVDPELKKER